MALSLRQLHAFVQAADGGSLSQAAQALRVTPSAASLLVRQLEQTLGLQLFDRGPRGLCTTEGGRLMLPLARQVLQGTARMEQLALSRRQLLHGHLRLAATPALARHLLVPVLGKFAARYPEITLNMNDRLTTGLAEAVAQGDADVALATLDGDEPEGVASELLLRDPLCVVCHRDDPLAQLEHPPWQALDGGALVVLDPAGGIRAVIDRALAEQQVAVRPSFEVSHFGTAISLVEQGLGRAVLPSFLLSFGAPAAVVARALAPAYTRDISMLWRRGAASEPAVMAFAALLRRELGD